MSSIQSLVTNQQASQVLQSSSQVRANRPAVSALLGRADAVELSAAALAASRGQAVEGPEGETADTQRAEKLARIRQQIVNGTYETDDKLAVVADRIAQQFGQLGQLGQLGLSGQLGQSGQLGTI
jgi:anti-sigma28 factor (negative regulator of flagellin synthesis)